MVWGPHGAGLRPGRWVAEGGASPVQIIVAFLIVGIVAAVILVALRRVGL